VQPAHHAFFGARCGVVHGPDGYVDGIMGPVRSGRRSMTDAPG
jgi:hypothetical protein